MDEREFTETYVDCIDCDAEFPIMIHDQRGETVTICENCMTHMEVVVQDGEVSRVTPT